MPEITSEQVAKLRAQTGAGLMDCKRALTDAGGDTEKAIKILREKGAASAAKRAEKVTADGYVTSYVDPAGQAAVLLELNCETDFVARTDDFQKLMADLARTAAQSPKPWSSPQEAPQDKIKAAAAKLGENIQLREKRFARFDRSEPGIFSVYIHPSGGYGKVGVLLDLSAPGQALSAADTQALGKDLAMQVAAANPKWVRREDVPANLLEQEKQIAQEQAKRDNKPEKIWDKIIQGKLQQFFQQFVLLDQPFVKAEGGKTTVGQLVEQVSKKVGAPLAPKRFVRLKVGEEE